MQLQRHMDEFGRIDIQFLRPDCAVVAVATTSMFAHILINCYDHDVTYSLQSPSCIGKHVSKPYL